MEENTLIHSLFELFPDACPDFLRNKCRGKSNTADVLNKLISEILTNGNYPKCHELWNLTKEANFEQQLEIVKQMLPNADPSYLEENCIKFIDKPDKLKKFVSELTESSKYPTKTDYVAKQRIFSQQRFYTTEFNATEYLKIIPDPTAVFADPNKKDAKLDEKSFEYAFCFLSKRFLHIPGYIVKNKLQEYNHNIFITCVALENVDRNLHLTSKRKPNYYKAELTQNISIPLLQEIAFIEHRDELELMVDTRKAREAEDKMQAKLAGFLQTCGCCFDEEIMPTDIYECGNGCIFCRACIRKSAEVTYGNGKLDFPCLNGCSSYFSLQTLQTVLHPNMFSKIIQKKQLEEVKAAGMEGLEMCPFCDFAIIPAKQDKVFRCLNPECMKETCRACKEPAHLPLKCDEVEKQGDVELRTYVENKMSEALLRKCYKCGLRFIKAYGCNKMTCSCGAMMCYICNQPVTNYKHFGGPGRCPLYIDTNKLHENAVKKAANLAKKEKGLDSDNKKMKNDPTSDLQSHYQEIAQRNSATASLLGLPFAGNVIRYFVGDRVERLAELYQEIQRM